MPRSPCWVPPSAGRRSAALEPARRPPARDPQRDVREDTATSLASIAEKKQQVRTQVEATFTMFNSIVAIAIIVSLFGVINTLAWPCPCSSARARSASCAPSVPPAGRSGAPCSTRACPSAVRGAITGVLFGLAVGAAWIAPSRPTSSPAGRWRARPSVPRRRHGPAGPRRGRNATDARDALTGETTVESTLATVPAPRSRRVPARRAARSERRGRGAPPWRAPRTGSPACPRATTSPR